MSCVDGGMPPPPHAGEGWGGGTSFKLGAAEISSPNRCAGDDGARMLPATGAFRGAAPPPALPRARRAVRGKLRIFEPQLIDREFGFGLARIDWRRLVDFCDRTSHEQSLADEFCKAQIENFQGIQTLREAQEQIGDHRGDDLQADSVAVVADELTKIEMLLDPAEQQFNLPAPLVNVRNLDCGAFEIVGDEGDGPALITLDLDASQRDRQLGIALAGEHDIIISDDNVVLASNHESKVAIALPQINVQLDKCCATYLNTIDC